MSLEVINDTVQPKDDGLFENSMGGTELMDRGLTARIDPRLLSKFNIVKSRAKESSIKEDQINLFWAHDLVEDPAINYMYAKKLHEKFNRFIFVSDWQKQKYEDFYGGGGVLAPSKSVVMKNAIVPIDVNMNKDKKLPKDETIRIIYHTTPHRGLEILCPVVDELAKTHKIHLDVFSSFDIYGWKERDNAYKGIFEQIKNHPNMSYHGFQPNNVVREALKKAHIFAYPSIWQETSCLSLIEAMSAGVYCVHPNLAALPETGGGFGGVYQYTENKNEHANLFYAVLNHHLTNYRNLVTNPETKKSFLDNLVFQKMWTDARYDWALRERQWTSFLSNEVEFANYSSEKSS